MEKHVIEDLIKEHAPFYQRIQLPHGLTTTDAPNSWYQDEAWDNVIDEITISDAARYRPEPKWRHLQVHMPSLQDQIVLEVGSNCGFFSFEFAKTAKQVVGIDVSIEWHKKSLLLAQLKNVTNASFYLQDFMLLTDLTELTIDRPKDFFSPSGININIVPNICDIVFCSTVIDHVYFPFLFIYKMLMNAKSYAIIDTPIIDHWHPSDKFGHTQFLHLDGPSDGCHHGYSATLPFWKFLLKRLNVKDEAVRFVQYSERNLCMIINTSSWQPASLGC